MGYEVLEDEKPGYEVLPEEQAGYEVVEEIATPEQTEKPSVQAEPTEPVRPSLIGASLRSVGEQVIPGASAVAGTLLGAAAGAPGGPVGIAAGALAGGTLGYKIGETGQQGLARLLAGEQGYEDYQRLREADKSRYPIATTSLEIATPIAIGAGAARPTLAIDRFQQAFKPQIAPVARAAEEAAAGQPIRPGTVGEAGFESGVKAPEFKMPEPPKGYAIAKTALRELKSEKVPTAVKAEIATQPDTVRKIYGVAAKRGELEDLPTNELEKIARESTDPIEVQGASALLYGRKVDENPANAAANFNEFVKLNSLFGLGLRNAQEYINTPAGYVSILKQQAESVGRKIPAQVEQKLTDLFNKSKQSKDALKAAINNYRNNLTDDSAKLAEEAQKTAQRDAVELQRYSRNVIPKRFLTETVPQAIQLTLLTPLSLTKNIFFNVNRAVAQTGVRAIANVGDSVISFLSKQPKTIAQSPTTARAALGGAISGLKEAGRTFFKTGIPEKAALAGEGVKGTDVFKSLAQAITGKDLVVNERGRVAVADRIRKFAEGVIGSYTEPMGRGLAVGDLPFRRAAEARLIAERALLKGASKEEALAAARFPKKSELSAIENEAAKATFQQNTKLTSAIQRVADVIASIPAVGPLLLRANIPYIKTPVNVVSDVVDIAVPPIAFVKSIYYANKGDRRQALDMAARGIVGSVMGMAASALYRAGLITGSAGKSEKQRGIEYEVQPPNTLNKSGLERLLRGEDPSIQPGDEIRSFENFGYLGTVFNVYANVLSKEGSSGIIEDAANVAFLGIPNVASYTLNQTFLKSTNTLLNAINREQYDGYLQSLYGSVSSVAFPGTLQAINRATREYMVDIKSDDKLQGFQNVLKSKMPEFAANALNLEKLPLTRNMWGEPVKQTPEGENPFFYNFFDVTRSRSVKSDESNLFLYKIWKDTKNPDVLPSVPGRNITIKGTTYRLTEEQYANFQEEVGRRRKALVDRDVESPTFIMAEPEFQIKRLKSSYEKGLEDGRKQFIKLNREDLVPMEK
jgi:Skp family chaperone for outer membrane proteins